MGRNPQRELVGPVPASAGPMSRTYQSEGVLALSILLGALCLFSFARIGRAL